MHLGLQDSSHPALVLFYFTHPFNLNILEIKKFLKYLVSYLILPNDTSGLIKIDLLMSAVLDVLRTPNRFWPRAETL